MSTRSWSWPGGVLALAILPAVLPLSCRGESQESPPGARSAAAPTDSALSTPGSAPAPAPVPVASDSAAGPGSPPPTTCPAGMATVDGGIFWMGSQGVNDEESPRHRVGLRSFCMDRTEVTVDAYAACVTDGACKPAHPEISWCNAGKPGRGRHPINCIDWPSAAAVCAWGKKRLPSEREWEYAARGGAEERAFSWGREPPDGRSCYSHEGTCEVGSYPPGAYDLLDVSGNVWEWTGSWFGKYPGESATGITRVYRGGSFSRRFPKWLRNGLRNRFKPEEWGAHLGVRCAADLAGSPCPAGSHPAEAGQGCVLDDDPLLAAGVTTKSPGPPPAPGERPAAAPRPSAEAGSAPSAEPAKKAPREVSVTRDPQFDGDCAKWKPGRPAAYAVRGGEFADRQKTKGGLGCVNRDVGVGWSSVCCPR